MTNPSYPPYSTSSGYMTDAIRTKYLDGAIKSGNMPSTAHRIAQVVSLNALDDPHKPIQFWQLYSVLGSQPIITMVSRFYDKVFADEPWFRSVFERVAPKRQHINTQSSMWVDVMGGGHQYHGGEFRLNFHHTHNAMELMNDKGAERWVKLMNETLNESTQELTTDPRVRIALNTFLDFFMEKYAGDFGFDNSYVFGETNAPYRLRINFLKLTSDEIAALSEEALRHELHARRIDVDQLPDKQSLINKALSL